MADKKKNTSTKRFGTRYGRSLKDKVADMESGHRGRHKCPYCGKNGIKRLAAGIWTCRICNVKFAGNAYSISSKMISQHSGLNDSEKNVSKSKEILKKEEDM
jgi:large subunit ribosomal protein L37Ae